MLPFMNLRFIVQNAANYTTCDRTVYLLKLIYVILYIFKERNYDIFIFVAFLSGGSAFEGKNLLV